MEACSGREGRRAFQVDRWSGVAGGGFGRGWGHSWEIICKHLCFLFANTFMCIISFESRNDWSSIHFREDRQDEESKSSVSGLHSLSAGEAGTSPSAPSPGQCHALCNSAAAGLQGRRLMSLRGRSPAAGSPRSRVIWRAMLPSSSTQCGLL